MKTWLRLFALKYSYCLLNVTHDTIFLCYIRYLNGFFLPVTEINKRILFLNLFRQCFSHWRQNITKVT